MTNFSNDKLELILKNYSADPYKNKDFSVATENATENEIFEYLLHKMKDLYNKNSNMNISIDSAREMFDTMIRGVKKQINIENRIKICLALMSNNFIENKVIRYFSIQLQRARNIECPICLDFDVEHPVQLVCKHYFCQKCLISHIDTQNSHGYNLSCPLCRHGIKLLNNFSGDDTLLLKINQKDVDKSNEFHDPDLDSLFWGGQVRNPIRGRSISGSSVWYNSIRDRLQTIPFISNFDEDTMSNISSSYNLPSTMDYMNFISSLNAQTRSNVGLLLNSYFVAHTVTEKNNLLNNLITEFVNERFELDGNVVGDYVLYHELDRISAECMLKNNLQTINTRLSNINLSEPFMVLLMHRYHKYDITDTINMLLSQ
jgi:hypothetical protein